MHFVFPTKFCINYCFQIHLRIDNNSLCKILWGKPNALWVIWKSLIAILVPRGRALFGKHQESRPLVVQHRKSAIHGLPVTLRMFRVKSDKSDCILVPRGRASFGQHQESRPLAKSNTGSPRFTDFPSLCACSESSLTNLIGSDLNLLCLQSHSKTECRWTRPEVAILGADQKERGLGGREWSDWFWSQSIDRFHVTSSLSKI